MEKTFAISAFGKTKEVGFHLFRLGIGQVWENRTAIVGRFRTGNRTWAATIQVVDASLDGQQRVDDLICKSRWTRSECGTYAYRISCHHLNSNRATPSAWRE